LILTFPLFTDAFHYGENASVFFMQKNGGDKAGMRGLKTRKSYHKIKKGDPDKFQGNRPSILPANRNK
jgi:hypothetical protein